MKDILSDIPTLKELEKIMLISLLEQKRLTLSDIYRVQKYNVDWMNILEEKGEFVFKWIDEDEILLSKVY